MDATPDVEPLKPWRARQQPKAGAKQQSVEAVRHEIYSTLDDLRARVEELQEYVHFRFGSIGDPLHVRERIQEQPIRVCGIALATGIACGVLRVHRLPLLVVRNVFALSSGIVRGASATVGSKIASDLVSLVMGSHWQSGAER
jgi:hypothetical protein